MVWDDERLNYISPSHCVPLSHITFDESCCGKWSGVSVENQDGWYCCLQWDQGLAASDYSPKHRHLDWQMLPHPQLCLTRVGDFPLPLEDRAHSLFLPLSFTSHELFRLWCRRSHASHTFAATLYCFNSHDFPQRNLGTTVCWGCWELPIPHRERPLVEWV